jgi:hypothetical protein
MTSTDLRRVIRDHGLTFKKAGELMGVSEPTIRRLVSPSRTNPVPLRDVLALSAALEGMRAREKE